MFRNIISTPKRTVKQARALRSNTTTPERLLWKKIRRKQIGNCKFRRQVPLGPYIADFLCAEKKLIIEVDGGSHSSSVQISHDAKRDAYLRKHGFKILRFTNAEVKESIAWVLMEISNELGFIEPIKREGADS